MGSFLRMGLAALVAGCGRSTTRSTESPSAAPSASSSGAESTRIPAYAENRVAHVKARVLCATRDAAPVRWSDVGIVGRDASAIAECDRVVRVTCDGRGSVVRGCSADAMPAPLVSRDTFVMREAGPTFWTFETFPSAHDCEGQLDAHRRDPRATERAWIEARMAEAIPRGDAAAKEVVAAERRVDEARASGGDATAAAQALEQARARRQEAENALMELRSELHDVLHREPACLRAGQF